MLAAGGGTLMSRKRISLQIECINKLSEDRLLLLLLLLLLLRRSIDRRPPVGSAFLPRASRISPIIFSANSSFPVLETSSCHG